MPVTDSLGSLLQNEIEVVKNVLESQFSNLGTIFGSLAAKAPQLSGSVSIGFKKAKLEFKNHYNKLDKTTQAGFKQVKLQRNGNK